MAAEPERVGDRDQGLRPVAVRAALERARLAGHVVEVELGVALLPADASAARCSRRSAPTVAIASTAPAAPSRCPIADLVDETGTSVAALAERQLQRLGLRAVVERRRGPVRVHVVDDRPARRPASASASSIARAASRPVGSGAVRWWASELARVAEDLAEHAPRRARRRARRPRARARRRPRPSRSRRGGRRRAARCRSSRSRPSRAKAARGDVGERGLRAAGDDGVGVAGCDHPLRLADRVRAGRAGRHDAEASRRAGRGAWPRAAAAALPISIGTASGETAFGAPVAEHVLLLLERAEPADPGADHAADPLGVVRQLLAPSRRPSTASSAAAIASWVKRSERRASLRERKSVGVEVVAARRRRRRSRTRRRPSARSASSRRRPAASPRRRR